MAGDRLYSGQVEIAFGMKGTGDIRRSATDLLSVAKALGSIETETLSADKALSALLSRLSTQAKGSKTGTGLMSGLVIDQFKGMLGDLKNLPPGFAADMRKELDVAIGRMFTGRNVPASGLNSKNLIPSLFAGGQFFGQYGNERRQLDNVSVGPQGAFAVDGRPFRPSTAGTGGLPSYLYYQAPGAKAPVPIVGGKMPGEMQALIRSGGMPGLDLAKIAPDLKNLQVAIKTYANSLFDAAKVVEQSAAPMKKRAEADVAWDKYINSLNRMERELNSNIRAAGPEIRAFAKARSEQYEAERTANNRGQMGGALFSTVDRSMDETTRQQMRDFYGKVEGFTASGASPKDAYKMAQHADVKLMADQYERMNNMFGRTAVAFTYFYTIQAGIRGAVSLSRELELSLIRTRALTGDNFPGQNLPGNTELMKRQLFDIGGRTGLRPQQLAAAANTAFQAAPLSTKRALGVVEQAGYVTQVTGANVETVTDILMAASNAWKMDGTQLQKFSAELVQTWRDGVVELDEMKNGLGRVFQTARLAGFSGDEGMRELLTLVAAVTKEAGSASNNMQILSRLFSDIARPKIQENLRKEGIAVDRENPMNTIMGVLTRPDASQAITRIFPLEQSRRAASVLLSQLDYIKQRLGGTSYALDLFKSAVETVMGSAVMETEKVNAELAKMATIVGDDLRGALHSALQPTLAILNALEEIGKANPKIATTTGALRGLGEGIAMFGIVGMGARAAGTLFGANVPLRAAPATLGGGLASPFMRMGDLLRGTMQGVGLAGGGRGFNELESEIGGFNRGALSGAGLGSSLRMGASAEGAAAGGVMAGGGASLGLGIGVAAIAAVLAVETAWRSYMAAEQARVGELQQMAEERMEKVKSILDTRTEALSAYNEGLNATPSQQKDAAGNAIASIERLMELYPDLEKKYGSQFSMIKTMVEANSNLAGSYDKVGTSINALMKAMSMDQAKEWMKQQMEVIKLQRELENTQYNSGWEQTKTFASGAVSSLVGMIAGLVTLQNPFDPTTGAGQVTTAPYVARDKQHELALKNLDNLEKQLQQQLKQVEIDANTNVPKTEDQTRNEEREKLVQDTQKNVRELLKKYQNEVAIADRRADVQQETQGLSEQARDEYKKQLLRESSINTYLQLLATDVGDTAGLAKEILQNEFPDLQDTMQEWIDSAGDAARATAAIAKILEPMDKAAKDIANALDDFQLIMDRRQNYFDNFFKTSDQILDMISTMFPTKAQPLMKLLSGGKMSEAKLLNSIEGLRLTEGFQYSQYQGINEQITNQKDALAKLGGLGLTEDQMKEQSKPINEKIRDLERQKNKLSDPLVANLESVAGNFLDVMAVPFGVRSFFKNTEFNKKDPGDVAAANLIKQLRGSDFLTTSPFAKDPGKFLEEVGKAVAPMGLNLDQLQTIDGSWGSIITLLQRLQKQGKPLTSMNDNELLGFYSDLTKASAIRGSGGGVMSIEQRLQELSQGFGTINGEFMPELLHGFQTLVNSVTETAAQIQKIGTDARAAMQQAFDNAQTGSGNAIDLQLPSTAQGQPGTSNTPIDDLLTGTGTSAGGGLTVPGQAGTSTGIPEIDTQNQRQSHWDKLVSRFRPLGFSDKQIMDLDAAGVYDAATAVKHYFTPEQISYMQGLGWSYEQMLQMHSPDLSSAKGATSTTPVVDGNERFTNPYSKFGKNSGYGYRIHPITHKRKFHDGVDLALPEGTNVNPLGSGRVSFAGKGSGRYKGYGNVVAVDHGGVTTFYAHMENDSIKVGVGDVVNQSSVLGLSGSTGLSTGPHLHVGAYDTKSGASLNPETLYGKLVPFAQQQANAAAVQSQAAQTQLAASNVFSAAVGFMAQAGGKGVPNGFAPNGGVDYINGAPTFNWNAPGVPGEYQVNGGAGIIDYPTGSAISGASSGGSSGGYPGAYWCSDCGSWLDANGNSIPGYLDQNVAPPGANGGGNMGDYINWSGSGPRMTDGGKDKKQKKEGYDPFSQALIGGINSFTQSLINGASVKEALQGALQQMVGGISQAIGSSIAAAIPGPAGGILGALGGGLFGLLATKVFKIGRKKKDQKKPLLVEVANFPELVKMFTLPSSAYFHPTGLNRIGSIIQNNSSVVNVSASPKVADTVSRALNSPIFLSQRKRGLAY